MTGGLVLGGGTRGFRGIDYARQTARIRIDDTLACEATGSLPVVNPVPLVVFMSNHLAARTGGFRAGDVLTTGTWTGMVPARPGSRVHAVFPGIGEAALEFG
jgi:2-keto-4-pentenoate hydratase